MNATAPTLFDPDTLEVPTKGRTDPVMGWREFVADNPRAYSVMVGRANYLVTYHMHLSIYALFEWLRNLDVKAGDRSYKIDHRWTNPAREMLIADYPEFAKHLRTRGGGAS